MPHHLHVLTITFLITQQLLVCSFTIAFALSTPALDKIMLPKLVLLDRDGVINRDVGAPGVLDKSQLELTPNAGVAIGRLKRAGCKIAVVTNQSCVGKGLISEAYLVENIHKQLQAMLLEEDCDAVIEHVLYCTSLRDSGDPRMKPNPGMLIEAMEMFRADPEETVLIGDAFRDLIAASGAGIKLRVLVETGYGHELISRSPNLNKCDGVELIDDENFNDTLMPPVSPFLYTTNLNTAVEWILSRGDQ